MKYARILNNTVVEIIDIDQDINELYHPLAAKEFEQFDELAEVGYQLIDGVWTAPKVYTEEEIRVLKEQANTDNQ